MSDSVKLRAKLVTMILKVVNVCLILALLQVVAGNPINDQSKENYLEQEDSCREVCEICDCNGFYCEDECICECNNIDKDGSKFKTFLNAFLNF